MKTIKLFSAVLLCSAVISGCSKSNDSSNNNPDTTPKWQENVTISSVTEAVRVKAPAINSYTVSGTIGGSITNDSIQISVPANAFASINGTAYTGNVTMKMQTIRNTSHMIYSGVTTTTKDEMLLSDGMFMLEAYDNSNNKLKLRNGSKLNANIMFGYFNIDNKVFKGKTNTTGANNKVEWDVWDSTSVKRGGNKGTIIFGLDSLFQWCNLDRYMNQTPLSDITVFVPTGFTNVNTDCYLKYTGENSCAYIPSNSTSKSFSTVGLHYKVVVGRAAKILVFAKKDSKFYYNSYTISAITTNQIIVLTSMTETTESNLHSIIEAF